MSGTFGGASGPVVNVHAAKGSRHLAAPGTIMKNQTLITALSLTVVGCCQFAQAQGYSPAEAVGKMKVADGLRVRLVASEPEVRDPILVKCDDRGRLWTIQYLQYPNPAGLKRVKVDRWSRTVYDRVPEPPPRGPRGADRITILEDTDGDGRADKFRRLRRRAEPRHRPGVRPRRRVRAASPLLAVLSRSQSRRRARRRSRGAAHGLRHGRRAVVGQPSDVGARRLAVRRQRQHDDVATSAASSFSRGCGAIIRSPESSSCSAKAAGTRSA